MVSRHLPLLAVLITTLLATACIPRYRVATERDDFAQRTVRRMEANLLGAPGGGRDWVALNVEEVRARGDSARYALVLQYRSDGEPLRIRAGESLLLLADTQRIALSGARSRREQGRLGVREEARYATTRALLERLAAAREVRVRVVGSRYYVDRTFGEANFLRLRRFLDPALPAGPAPGVPAPPTPGAARPPRP